MPMKINSVGPSILPAEKPAASSSQSSGAAAPSPQQLQARIEEGIQKAAHNLDHIMGAVTGNATLPPADVAIQQVMNELQNKKRSEDEIKDATKTSEGPGDSQLQKAAQSIEQLTDTVTNWDR